MGGPALGSVVAGGLAGSLGSGRTSLLFAAACFLLVLFVGTGSPAPYRATSVRVDDPAGNTEFRRD